MTKSLEKPPQENNTLLYILRDIKTYRTEFTAFSKIFIKGYLERFNTRVHKELLRRIKETDENLIYFLNLCERNKAKEYWDKLNILNQQKKKLEIRVTNAFFTIDKAEFNSFQKKHEKICSGN